MGKRNPNNYGCVTKLKGKRSRPWIVKVTVYDSEGRARQVPVDYAETEEQANIILAQYNNNPWIIQTLVGSSASKTRKINPDCF